MTTEMADRADTILLMEPSLVTEMVEEYGQNYWGWHPYLGIIGMQHPRAPHMKSNRNSRLGGALMRYPD